MVQLAAQDFHHLGTCLISEFAGSTRTHQKLELRAVASSPWNRRWSSVEIVGDSWVQRYATLEMSIHQKLTKLSCRPMPVALSPKPETLLRWVQEGQPLDQCIAKAPLLSGTRGDDWQGACSARDLNTSSQRAPCSFADLFEGRMGRMAMSQNQISLSKTQMQKDPQT